MTKPEYQHWVVTRDFKQNNNNNNMSKLGLHALTKEPIPCSSEREIFERKCQQCNLSRWVKDVEDFKREDNHIFENN